MRLLWANSLHFALFDTICMEHETWLLRRLLFQLLALNRALGSSDTAGPRSVRQRRRQ